MRTIRDIDVTVQALRQPDGASECRPDPPFKLFPHNRFSKTLAHPHKPPRHGTSDAFYVLREGQRRRGNPARFFEGKLEVRAADDGELSEEAKARAKPPPSSPFGHKGS